jgi:hypothetical protein
MVSIKISSATTVAILATLVQSSPTVVPGDLVERDCPQCGYAGPVYSYDSISSILSLTHFFSAALNATMFVLVGRIRVNGVARCQTGRFDLISVVMLEY